MASTDRKSAARAYMAKHGVNYTTALRALGAPTPSGPDLHYMLLRLDGHRYEYPVGEGPVFNTLEEAKAAAGDGGDVITTGFFAPDTAGGEQQWHNYPYGNWLTYVDDWPSAGMRWSDHPNDWEGWSPKWFKRFPTPTHAAKAPGITNGDVTSGGLVRDGFRYVTGHGSLVTRLLPRLGDEATLSRISSESDMANHSLQMQKITAALDPKDGIRLKEASTPYGTVPYWEFETPGLANFISWSSLDRYQRPQLDALADWTNDDESSLNQVDETRRALLARCEECDRVVTRNHPLAPGKMIGTYLDDHESPTELKTPASSKELAWDDLLLLHLFGDSVVANHDGCREYWRGDDTAPPQ